MWVRVCVCVREKDLDNGAHVGAFKEDLCIVEDGFE